MMGTVTVLGCGKVKLKLCSQVIHLKFAAAAAAAMAMAMSMEALRAASVAPVLHVHRHHSPRRHARHAAAALFRFQTGVSSLSKCLSSSRRCCTPVSRWTWGVRRASAAGSGAGGGLIRAGVDVEDVNSGLESCVEVAGDGSRFLHVMASSMHNVDNGESSGVRSDCNIIIMMRLLDFKLFFRRWKWPRLPFAMLI